MDYDALAKKHGGKAAAPDYEALAKKYGGTAASEPSMLDSIKQGTGNLVAGLVRGAGSIGATILAPKDIISDAIDGKGLTLESNRRRRQAMDEGLQSMGAETDSLLYKGGKLTGEIAGTAGAGGAVANALGRSATIAARAPNALQAIRTAGMSAGNATGATNALLRAGGGAVSGGVSAGMVNPEDAATGAVIGGVLPGALKVAGAAGQKVGQVLRGPEQAADVAQAVQAARGAGYVIPPTQARPTLGNRLLEGFSGKITTAQNSSAKNQAVINSKAATAIGLPGDTKLTPEVLDGVRAEAGKAYKAVSELGTFDSTGAGLPSSVNVTKKPANSLMGRPASESVDAGEVVRAWRQANADATAYFRQYGRDANPETLSKAKSAAAEAKTLDAFMLKSVEAAQKAAPNKLISQLASGAIDQQEFLQRSLAIARQGNLGSELKEARKLIAKTHSVEGALNPVTGSIDASKLAKQLEKGKPLTSELKEAAEFAARFPKASQTVEKMGSLPQTSPLDWVGGVGLSAATSNPLLLASIMSRPAARSLALSPAIQNRLVQPQGNGLASLVSPAARQFGYRAAPVALSDQ